MVGVRRGYALSEHLKVPIVSRYENHEHTLKPFIGNRVIADATTVWSPDRVESDILGMILGVFWSVQAVIMVREQLCDLGIPS